MSVGNPNNSTRERFREEQERCERGREEHSDGSLGGKIPVCPECGHRMAYSSRLEAFTCDRHEE